jgi:hypothetical protein
LFDARSKSNTNCNASLYDVLCLGRPAWEAAVGMAKTVVDSDEIVKQCQSFKEVALKIVNRLQLPTMPSYSDLVDLIDGLKGLPDLLDGIGDEGDGDALQKPIADLKQALAPLEKKFESVTAENFQKTCAWMTTAFPDEFLKMSVTKALMLNEWAVTGTAAQLF